MGSLGDWFGLWGYKRTPRFLRLNSGDIRSLNLWILEPFILPIFWMLINKILTSSLSKYGIYPELLWRCHVFPILHEQIPTGFSVEQFLRFISQFHSGIYMHSCKWHKLQACDAQFGWWLQDDFNPTRPISIDWVEASRRNPNKLGMWSLKSKFETTSQYVPHMPLFLPAQSRFVPAPFSVSGHSHHQVHLSPCTSEPPKTSTGRGMWRVIEQQIYLLVNVEPASSSQNGGWRWREPLWLSCSVFPEKPATESSSKSSDGSCNGMKCCNKS